MATIKEQIKYILSHPYMAVAIKDKDAMEHLLFETMYHVYATVATNSAKAYRANKSCNSPQIVEAIKDQEPPSNLDIRLPFVEATIPEQIIEVPVIQMAVVHTAPIVSVPNRVRIKNYPNPYQMKIEFPVIYKQSPFERFSFLEG